MKYTIITICFNSGKTLERTIKSVLAQTLKDYEYIIVDGCSKDNTLDIVKMYEPLFEGRLKWKSEPDKGIYDAMNKGIKRATGDIIGIVNSDDWLEPDALEKVYNAFTNNNCNVDTLYCGGINYVMANGVKVWPVNLKSFFNQAKLYVMAGIRHPGTFVPKEVYQKIGLFNDELRLSADQDFILRCYYGGVFFYDLKAVVSNMAEGGLSTGGDRKAREIAKSDRKKMLHTFGVSEVRYLWLYYSWILRNKVRSLLVALKLYR